MLRDVLAQKQKSRHSASSITFLGAGKLGMIWAGGGY